MIYSKFKLILSAIFLISTFANAQDFKDTYTVSSYGGMSQDGAVLSNIVFESTASNSYRWDDTSDAAKTDKLWKVNGNLSLDKRLNSSGYVYKNVLYPYNDFSSDFGDNYPIISPPESIEARIVLVNGIEKSGKFTTYSGAAIDGHGGEKNTPHRLEDYQISSVQITNAQSSAIENTIQNFLDRQSRETSNSNTSGSQDEENSSENNEVISSSTSSSSTNSSNESSTSSSSNNQDSEEQARVAEQNRLREQMVTDVATTASKFAGGFSEGIFTDLRAAVNFRLSENITDQDGNDNFTNMDMVTYDLGIGVGRNGFFSVGYGTPELNYEEGSMYKIGLGFDIFSVVPTGGKSGRYGVTLGIEGELGFGSTETMEQDREDIETEDGTIYGAAVTLRLFEIFYMGIGYGFINSDISGPDGNSSLKGNYTNTIVGLNIPF